MLQGGAVQRILGHLKVKVIKSSSDKEVSNDFNEAFGLVWFGLVCFCLFV